MPEWRNEITVAAAPTPPADDWRGCPSADEITAHEARGGRWRVRSRDLALAMWVTPKGIRCWWGESGRPPGSGYGWSASELGQEPMADCTHFQPVDADLKPMPWPTLKSAPKPATATVTATSTLTSTELDAYRRSVAEVVAPPTEKWTPKVGDVVRTKKFEDTGTIFWDPRMDRFVGEVGAIASIRHGDFQVHGRWLWPASALELVAPAGSVAAAGIAASSGVAAPSPTRFNFEAALAMPTDRFQDAFSKVIEREVAKYLERQTKKETTMPPVAASTLTVTVTSPRTLVDDLIEDGVEVAYREAGREATKLAHDLLVDALSLELSERDRDLGRDVLKQVLASEAGVALVGAVASFGLPEVARLIGRGADPRVLRLARECRREGVRPAAQRLISKFKELAGGAMGKLMGLISGLPAESAREGDDVAAGPQPALAAAGGSQVLYDAQVMTSAASAAAASAVEQRAKQ